MVEEAEIIDFDNMSNEKVVGYVDFVSKKIVDKGRTANHLYLVNAILSRELPCVDYPTMIKEYERSVKSLAKSNAKSRLELAPVYYTLWTYTLKPIYLNQFERTVRHCYFTLAKGKRYPDLGVDVNDKESLLTPIKFLDSNRRTLWIRSERYNADMAINKYKSIVGTNLHEGNS